MPPQFILSNKWSNLHRFDRLCDNLNILDFENSLGSQGNSRKSHFRSRICVDTIMVGRIILTVKEKIYYCFGSLGFRNRSLDTTKYFYSYLHLILRDSQFVLLLTVLFLTVSGFPNCEALKLTEGVNTNYYPDMLDNFVVIDCSLHNCLMKSALFVDDKFIFHNDDGFIFEVSPQREISVLVDANRETKRYVSPSTIVDDYKNLISIAHGHIISITDRVPLYNVGSYDLSNSSIVSVSLSIIASIGDIVFISDGTIYPRKYVFPGPISNLVLNDEGFVIGLYNKTEHTPSRCSSSALIIDFVHPISQNMTDSVLEGCWLPRGLISFGDSILVVTSNSMIRYRVSFSPVVPLADSISDREGQDSAYRSSSFVKECEFSVLSTIFSNEQLKFDPVLLPSGKVLLTSQSVIFLVSATTCQPEFTYFIGSISASPAFDESTGYGYVGTNDGMVVRFKSGSTDVLARLGSAVGRILVGRAAILVSLQSLILITPPREFWRISIHNGVHPGAFLLSNFTLSSISSRSSGMILPDEKNPRGEWRMRAGRPLLDLGNTLYQLDSFESLDPLDLSSTMGIAYSVKISDGGEMISTYSNHMRLTFARLKEMMIVAHAFPTIAHRARSLLSSKEGRYSKTLSLLLELLDEPLHDVRSLLFDFSIAVFSLRAPSPTYLNELLLCAEKMDEADEACLRSLSTNRPRFIHQSIVTSLREEHHFNGHSNNNPLPQIYIPIPGFFTSATTSRACNSGTVLAGPGIMAFVSNVDFSSSSEAVYFQHPLTSNVTVQPAADSCFLLSGSHLNAGPRATFNSSFRVPYTSQETDLLPIDIFTFCPGLGNFSSSLPPTAVQIELSETPTVGSIRLSSSTAGHSDWNGNGLINIDYSQVIDLEDAVDASNSDQPPSSSALHYETTLGIISKYAISPELRRFVPESRTDPYYFVTPFSTGQLMVTGRHYVAIYEPSGVLVEFRFTEFFVQFLGLSDDIDWDPPYSRGISPCTSVPNGGSSEDIKASATPSPSANTKANKFFPSYHLKDDYPRARYRLFVESEFLHFIDANGESAMVVPLRAAEPEFDEGDSRHIPFSSRGFSSALGVYPLRSSSFVPIVPQYAFAGSSKSPLSWRRVGLSFANPVDYAGFSKREYPSFLFNYSIFGYLSRGQYLYPEDNTEMDTRRWAPPLSERHSLADVALEGNVHGVRYRELNTLFAHESRHFLLRQPRFFVELGGFVHESATIVIPSHPSMMPTSSGNQRIPQESAAWNTFTLPDGSMLFASHARVVVLTLRPQPQHLMDMEPADAEAPGSSEDTDRFIQPKEVKVVNPGILAVVTAVALLAIGGFLISLRSFAKSSPAVARWARSFRYSDSPAHQHHTDSYFRSYHSLHSQCLDFRRRFIWFCLTRLGVVAVDGHIRLYESFDEEEVATSGIGSGDISAVIDADFLGGNLPSDAISLLSGLSEQRSGPSEVRAEGSLVEQSSQSPIELTFDLERAIYQHGFLQNNNYTSPGGIPDCFLHTISSSLHTVAERLDEASESTLLPLTASNGEKVRRLVVTNNNLLLTQSQTQATRERRLASRIGSAVSASPGLRSVLKPYKKYEYCNDLFCSSAEDNSRFSRADSRSVVLSEMSETEEETLARLTHANTLNNSGFHRLFNENSSQSMISESISNIEENSPGITFVVQPEVVDMVPRYYFEHYLRIMSGEPQDDILTIVPSTSTTDSEVLLTEDSQGADVASGVGHLSPEALGGRDIDLVGRFTKRRASLFSTESEVRPSSRLRSPSSSFDVSEVFPPELEVESLEVGLDDLPPSTESEELIDFSNEVVFHSFDSDHLPAPLRHANPFDPLESEDENPVNPTRSSSFQIAAGPNRSGTALSFHYGGTTIVHNQPHLDHTIDVTDQSEQHLQSDSLTIPLNNGLPAPRGGLVRLSSSSRSADHERFIDEPIVGPSATASASEMAEHDSIRVVARGSSALSMPFTSLSLLVMCMLIAVNPAASSITSVNNTHYFQQLPSDPQVVMIDCDPKYPCHTGRSSVTPSFLCVQVAPLMSSCYDLVNGTGRRNIMWDTGIDVLGDGLVPLVYGGEEFHIFEKMIRSFSPFSLNANRNLDWIEFDRSIAEEERNELLDSKVISRNDNTLDYPSTRLSDEEYYKSRFGPPGASSDESVLEFMSDNREMMSSQLMRARTRCFHYPLGVGCCVSEMPPFSQLLALYERERSGADASFPPKRSDLEADRTGFCYFEEIARAGALSELHFRSTIRLLEPAWSQGDVEVDDRRMKAVPNFTHFFFLQLRHAESFEHYRLDRDRNGRPGASVVTPSIQTFSEHFLLDVWNSSFAKSYPHNIVGEWHLLHLRTYFATGDPHKKWDTPLRDVNHEFTLEADVPLPMEDGSFRPRPVRPVIVAGSRVIVASKCGLLIYQWTGGLSLSHSILNVLDGVSSSWMPVSEYCSDSNSALRPFDLVVSPNNVVIWSSPEFIVGVDIITGNRVFYKDFITIHRQVSALYHTRPKQPDSARSTSSPPIPSYSASSGRFEALNSMMRQNLRNYARFTECPSYHYPSAMFYVTTTSGVLLRWNATHEWAVQESQSMLGRPLLGPHAIALFSQTMVLLAPLRMIGRFTLQDAGSAGLLDPATTARIAHRTNCSREEVNRSSICHTRGSNYFIEIDGTRTPLERHEIVSSIPSDPMKGNQIMCFEDLQSGTTLGLKAQVRGCTAIYNGQDLLLVGSRLFKPVVLESDYYETLTSNMRSELDNYNGLTPFVRQYYPGAYHGPRAAVYVGDGPQAALSDSLDFESPLLEVAAPDIQNMINAHSYGLESLKMSSSMDMPFAEPDKRFGVIVDDEIKLYYRDYFRLQKGKAVAVARDRLLPLAAEIWSLNAPANKIVSGGNWTNSLYYEFGVKDFNFSSRGFQFDAIPKFSVKLVPVSPLLPSGWEDIGVLGPSKIYVVLGSSDQPSQRKHVRQYLMPDYPPLPGSLPFDFPLHLLNVSQADDPFLLPLALFASRTFDPYYLKRWYFRDLNVTQVDSRGFAQHSSGDSGIIVINDSELTSANAGKRSARKVEYLPNLDNLSVGLDSGLGIDGVDNVTTSHVVAMTDGSFIFLMLDKPDFVGPSQYGKALDSYRVIRFVPNGVCSRAGASSTVCRNGVYQRYAIELPQTMRIKSVKCLTLYSLLIFADSTFVQLRFNYTTPPYLTASWVEESSSARNFSLLKARDIFTSRFVQGSFPFGDSTLLSGIADILQYHRREGGFNYANNVERKGKFEEIDSISILKSSGWLLDSPALFPNVSFHVQGASKSSSQVMFYNSDYEEFHSYFVKTDDSIFSISPEGIRSVLNISHYQKLFTGSWPSYTTEVTQSDVDSLSDLLTSVRRHKTVKDAIRSRSRNEATVPMDSFSKSSNVMSSISSPADSSIFPGSKSSRGTELPNMHIYVDEGLVQLLPLQAAGVERVLRSLSVHATYVKNRAPLFRLHLDGLKSRFQSHILNKRFLYLLTPYSSVLIDCAEDDGFGLLVPGEAVDLQQLGIRRFRDSDISNRSPLLSFIIENPGVSAFLLFMTIVILLASSMDCVIRFVNYCSERSSRKSGLFCSFGRITYSLRFLKNRLARGHQYKAVSSSSSDSLPGSMVRSGRFEVRNTVLPKGIPTKLHSFSGVPSSDAIQPSRDEHLTTDTRRSIPVRPDVMKLLRVSRLSSNIPIELLRINEGSHLAPPYVKGAGYSPQETEELASVAESFASDVMSSLRRVESAEYLSSNELDVCAETGFSGTEGVFAAQPSSTEHRLRLSSQGFNQKSAPLTYDRRSLSVTNKRKFIDTEWLSNGFSGPPMLVQSRHSRPDSAAVASDTLFNRVGSSIERIKLSHLHSNIPMGNGPLFGNPSRLSSYSTVEEPSFSDNTHLIDTLPPNRALRTSERYYSMNDIPFTHPSDRRRAMSVDQSSTGRFSSSTLLSGCEFNLDGGFSHFQFNTSLGNSILESSSASDDHPPYVGPVSPLLSISIPADERKGYNLSIPRNDSPFHTTFDFSEDFPRSSSFPSRDFRSDRSVDDAGEDELNSESNVSLRVPTRPGNDWHIFTDVLFDDASSYYSASTANKSMLSGLNARIPNTFRLTSHHVNIPLSQPSGKEGDVGIGEESSTEVVDRCCSATTPEFGTESSVDTLIAGGSSASTSVDRSNADPVELLDEVPRGHNVVQENVGGRGGGGGPVNRGVSGISPVMYLFLLVLSVLSVPTSAIYATINNTNFFPYLSDVSFAEPCLRACNFGRNNVHSGHILINMGREVKSIPIPQGVAVIHGDELFDEEGVHPLSSEERQLYLEGKLRRSFHVDNLDIRAPTPSTYDPDMLFGRVDRSLPHSASYHDFRTLSFSIGPKGTVMESISFPSPMDLRFVFHVYFRHHLLTISTFKCSMFISVVSPTSMIVVKHMNCDGVYRQGDYANDSKSIYWVLNIFNDTTINEGDRVTEKQTAQLIQVNPLAEPGAEVLPILDLPLIPRRRGILRAGSVLVVSNNTHVSAFEIKYVGQEILPSFRPLWMKEIFSSGTEMLDLVCNRNNELFVSSNRSIRVLNVVTGDFLWSKEGFSFADAPVIHPLTQEYYVTLRDNVILLFNATHAIPRFESVYAIGRPLLSPNNIVVPNSRMIFSVPRRYLPRVSIQNEYLSNIDTNAWLYRDHPAARKQDYSRIEHMEPEFPYPTDTYDDFRNMPFVKGKTMGNPPVFAFRDKIIHGAILDPYYYMSLQVDDAYERLKKTYLRDITRGNSSMLSHYIDKHFNASIGVNQSVIDKEEIKKYFKNPVPPLDLSSPFKYVRTINNKQYIADYSEVDDIEVEDVVIEDFHRKWYRSYSDLRARRVFNQEFFRHLETESFKNYEDYIQSRPALKQLMVFRRLTNHNIGSSVNSRDSSLFGPMDELQIRMDEYNYGMNSRKVIQFLKSPMIPSVLPIDFPLENMTNYSDPWDFRSLPLPIFDSKTFERVYQDCVLYRRINGRIGNSMPQSGFSFEGLLITEDTLSHYTSLELNFSRLGFDFVIPHMDDPGLARFDRSRFDIMYQRAPTISALENVTMRVPMSNRRFTKQLRPYNISVDAVGKIFFGVEYAEPAFVQIDDGSIFIYDDESHEVIDLKRYFPPSLCFGMFQPLLHNVSLVAGRLGWNSMPEANNETYLSKLKSIIIETCQGGMVVPLLRLPQVFKEISVSVSASLILVRHYSTAWLLDVETLEFKELDMKIAKEAVGIACSGCVYGADDDELKYRRYYTESFRGFEQFRLRLDRKDDYERRINHFPSSSRKFAEKRTTYPFNILQLDSREDRLAFVLNSTTYDNLVIDPISFDIEDRQLTFWQPPKDLPLDFLHKWNSIYRASRFERYSPSHEEYLSNLLSLLITHEVNKSFHYLPPTRPTQDAITIRVVEDDPGERLFLSEKGPLGRLSTQGLGVVTATAIYAEEGNDFYAVDLNDFMIVDLYASYAPPSRAGVKAEIAKLSKAFSINEFEEVSDLLIMEAVRRASGISPSTLSSHSNSGNNVDGSTGTGLGQLLMRFQATVGSVSIWDEQYFVYFYDHTSAFIFDCRPDDPLSWWYPHIKFVEMAIPGLDSLQHPLESSINYLIFLVFLLVVLVFFVVGSKGESVTHMLSTLLEHRVSKMLGISWLLRRCMSKSSLKKYSKKRTSSGKNTKRSTVIRSLDGNAYENLEQGKHAEGEKGANDDTAFANPALIRAIKRQSERAKKATMMLNQNASKRIVSEVEFQRRNVFEGLQQEHERLSISESIYNLDEVVSDIGSRSSDVESDNSEDFSSDSGHSSQSSSRQSKSFESDHIIEENEVDYGVEVDIENEYEDGDELADLDYEEVMELRSLIDANGLARIAQGAIFGSSGDDADSSYIDSELSHFREKVSKYSYAVPPTHRHGFMASLQAKPNSGVPDHSNYRSSSSESVSQAIKTPVIHHSSFAQHSEHASPSVHTDDHSAFAKGAGSAGRFPLLKLFRLSSKESELKVSASNLRTNVNEPSVSVTSSTAPESTTTKGRGISGLSPEVSLFVAVSLLLPSVKANHTHSEILDLGITESSYYPLLIFLILFPIVLLKHPSRLLPESNRLISSLVLIFMCILFPMASGFSVNNTHFFPYYRTHEVSVAGCGPTSARCGTTLDGNVHFASGALAWSIAGNGPHELPDYRGSLFRIFQEKVFVSNLFDGPNRTDESPEVHINQHIAPIRWDMQHMRGPMSSGGYKRMTFHRQDSHRQIEDIYPACVKQSNSTVIPSYANVTHANVSIDPAKVRGNDDPSEPPLPKEGLFCSMQLQWVEAPSLVRSANTHVPPLRSHDLYRQVMSRHEEVIVSSGLQLGDFVSTELFTAEPYPTRHVQLRTPNGYPEQISHCSSISSVETFLVCVRPDFLSSISYPLRRDYSHPIEFERLHRRHMLAGGHIYASIDIPSMEVRTTTTSTKSIGSIHHIFSESRNSLPSFIIAKSMTLIRPDSSTESRLMLDDSFMMRDYNTGQLNVQDESLTLEMNRASLFEFCQFYWHSQHLAIPGTPSAILEWSWTSALVFDCRSHLLIRKAGIYRVFNVPDIIPGAIFAFGRTLVIGTLSGGLIGLVAAPKVTDTLRLERIWAYPALVMEASADNRGFLYFFYSSELIALDAANGVEVFRIPLPANHTPVGTVSVAGDELFFSCTNGAVFFLNLKQLYQLDMEKLDYNIAGSYLQLFAKLPPNACNRVVIASSTYGCIGETGSYFVTRDLFPTMSLVEGPNHPCYGLPGLCRFLFRGDSPVVISDTVHTVQFGHKGKFVYDYLQVIGNSTSTNTTNSSCDSYSDGSCLSSVAPELLSIVDRVSTEMSIITPSVAILPPNLLNLVESVTTNGVRGSNFSKDGLIDELSLLYYDHFFEDSFNFRSSDYEGRGMFSAEEPLFRDQKGAILHSLRTNTVFGVKFSNERSNSTVGLSFSHKLDAPFVYATAERVLVITRDFRLRVFLIVNRTSVDFVCGELPPDPLSPIDPASNTEEDNSRWVFPFSPPHANMPLSYNQNYTRVGRITSNDMSPNSPQCLTELPMIGGSLAYALDSVTSVLVSTSQSIISGMRKGHRIYLSVIVEASVSMPHRRPYNFTFTLLNQPFLSSDGEEINSAKVPSLLKFPIRQTRMIHRPSGVIVKLKEFQLEFFQSRLLNDFFSNNSTNSSPGGIEHKIIGSIPYEDYQTLLLYSTPRLHTHYSTLSSKHEEKFLNMGVQDFEYDTVDSGYFYSGERDFYALQIVGNSRVTSFLSTSHTFITDIHSDPMLMNSNDMCERPLRWRGDAFIPSSSSRKQYNFMEKAGFPGNMPLQEVLGVYKSPLILPSDSIEPSRYSSLPLNNRYFVSISKLYEQSLRDYFASKSTFSNRESNIFDPMSHDVELPLLTQHDIDNIWNPFVNNLKVEELNTVENATKEDEILFMSTCGNQFPTRLWNEDGSSFVISAMSSDERLVRIQSDRMVVLDSGFIFSVDLSSLRRSTIPSSNYRAPYAVWLSIAVVCVLLLVFFIGKLRGRSFTYHRISTTATTMKSHSSQDRVMKDAKSEGSQSSASHMTHSTASHPKSPSRNPAYSQHECCQLPPSQESVNLSAEVDSQFVIPSISLPAATAGDPLFLSRFQHLFGATLLERHLSRMGSVLQDYLSYTRIRLVDDGSQILEEDDESIISGGTLDGDLFAMQLREREAILKETIALHPEPEVPVIEAAVPVGNAASNGIKTKKSPIPLSSGITNSVRSESVTTRLPVAVPLSTGVVAIPSVALKPPRQLPPLSVAENNINDSALTLIPATTQTLEETDSIHRSISPRCSINVSNDEDSLTDIENCITSDVDVSVVVSDG